MDRMNQEEGRYRVLLIAVGDNAEEEKESFCKDISENYGISFPLLRKIVDRCPIVLKKNLSLKKAETLAKTLKSFGAMVTVEERKDFSDVILEFQEMASYQLALESSYLRRTQSGAWNVIGRVKNISQESLNDIWVLVQLFEDIEELLTFDEIPIPLNPLPPGEASPFKVVFEGDLSIKRVSIAFKNSSGCPIPAVDRRKKREWMQVKIKDENGSFPSSAFLHSGSEEGPPFMDITEPSEEISIERDSDIQGAISQPFEIEGPRLPVEESREIEEEGGERVSGEILPLKTEETPLEVISEFTEKNVDGPSEMLEENKNQGKRDTEISLKEYEPSQKIAMPLLEEGRTQGEAVLNDLEHCSDDRRDILYEETLSEASVLEKSNHLLEEIPVGTEVREEETPSPFPWIENFRNSVEAFYQKPRDIFSMWFEANRKEDGFADPLHSLLTILVHARFDQMSQPGKALENTQRVFRLIPQPNLLLEEIPPLDGTQFFSGENWRDLFHRALPKLRQVANSILEKRSWNALDLERLIQVIPHMSDKNSRRAVRWIHELIPDIVEIDFSNTPISIGENLYRVASRLGVVDPNFDYYQGRNSMGDLKIQSFAKATFSHYPMKIEEPMTWVGTKEEEGGHCLPTQPQCEGCLFEGFCPRLYFHFNPSKKGMRGR